MAIRAPREVGISARAAWVPGHALVARPRKSADVVAWPRGEDQRNRWKDARRESTSPACAHEQSPARCPTPVATARDPAGTPNAVRQLTTARATSQQPSRHPCGCGGAAIPGSVISRVRGNSLVFLGQAVSRAVAAAGPANGRRPRATLGAWGSYVSAGEPPESFSAAQNVRTMAMPWPVVTAQPVS